MGLVAPLIYKKWPHITAAFNKDSRKMSPLQLIDKESSSLIKS